MRKPPVIRKPILSRLDVIEDQLKILEEQGVNRATRARLAKEIEINLAEVNEMFRSKPEELQEVPKPK